MEHFRIRINSLDPNMPTTFDLYVQIGDRLVLYKRAGERLEAQKIGQLEGKDVFFVHESDRAAYKKYIHGRVNDESLDPQTKALILRETSMALIEELFEHPDVGVALQGSKEVITNFLTFMDQESDAMAHLIGLSSHDFYTYNHSLDVSIYSLGLGQAAGFTDELELRELGQGALLHDIGKRFVDAAIICKNGPLNPEEWAQMKLHPTFGLKILMDYPEFSDSVRACVFEHHENHAGNGYPQQIKGEEIHPMARIVALVDTYDALTTKRSYNDPMSPTAALDFMKTKLSARFDPELLKALYSVLFKMEGVREGA